MSLGRRFAKDSAAYGLGEMVARGGAALAIPIIVHHVDPEEYGVYSLFQAVMAILTAILSLNFAGATSRLFIDYQGEERKVLHGTVWMLSTSLAAALALAALVLGPLVLPRALPALAGGPLFVLATAAAFFSATSQLPLVILRMEQRARLYAGISAGSFIVGISVQLALVIRGWGVLGLALGTLAGAVALALASLALLRPRVRLVWRSAIATDALRFALPQLPNALVDSLIFSADRFVLSRFVSIGALGHYTLAQQIASVAVSGVNALRASFTPSAIVEYGKGAANRPNVIRLGELFLVAASLLVAGVAWGASEWLEMFAPPSYVGAASVLGLLLLFSYSNVLRTLATLPYVFSKRVLFLPVSAVIHLALVVALLFALVPRWGIVGAAVAVLLAGIGRVAILQLHGAALAPVRFPTGRWLGVSVGMALCVQVLTSTEHLGVDLQRNGIKLGVFLLLAAAGGALARRRTPVHGAALSPSLRT